MTHAILTILGGLCLLLVIGRQSARIAYEEARADQAVEDARLAWVDRVLERERRMGRQIDPDDVLPGARAAGYLDVEDLR